MSYLDHIASCYHAQQYAVPSHSVWRTLMNAVIVSHHAAMRNSMLFVNYNTLMNAVIILHHATMRNSVLFGNYSTLMNALIK